MPPWPRSLARSNRELERDSAPRGGYSSGMEALKPIDLIVLLALALMVVMGYIQGVPRRLFGIAAIIFALLVAAQLRGPGGAYIAHQLKQKVAT